MTCAEAVAAVGAAGGAGPRRRPRPRAGLDHRGPHRGRRRGSCARARCRGTTIAAVLRCPGAETSDAETRARPRLRRLEATPTISPETPAAPREGPPRRRRRPARAAASATESSIEELGQLARERGRPRRRHAHPGAQAAGPRHAHRARQGGGGRARRRARSGADLLALRRRAVARPSSATSRRRSAARRSTARSSSSTSSPGARARREGRLQVELAQLDYLLPRLAGKGVLLSRLGGGIGTRGPGETKLETDRRRIRQRIQAVKRRDRARAPRRGTTRREARQRAAGAGGGARRLHERRQVDALQRAHPARRRRSPTSSS